MENTLLLYIIKVTLATAFFYALYMLLLRKDTFLQIRRFYFLFAILFSVIYPFISFELPTGTTIPVQPISFAELQEITITPQQQASSYTLYDMIGVLSLFVAAVLLLRLAVQVVKLLNMKRVNRSEDFDNYSLVRLKSESALPFSFFNWIFVDADTDHTQLDEIIAHEQVHVRQYHSADILLLQVFCICFWWNPIAWLIKKEIKMNLEYIADKGVIDKGYDSKKYQYLLLQATTGNTGISIRNHFNVSQLKKRITMMNKQKSSILNGFKYLIVAPLIGGLLLANAVQASPEGVKQLSDTLSFTVVGYKTDNTSQDTKQVTVQKTSKDKPFVTVEQMPAFSGGESAMNKFIADNLKYPIDAQNAGVEGRITLRFVIQATGEVSDVEVVNGAKSSTWPEAAKSINNEAIRVVKAMPNWIPGKQNGVAVPVYFTLPIVFRLTKSDKEKPKTVMMPNEKILYVVDGQIKDGADLQFIKPEDIESMSVLKDKAAIEKFGKDAEGKEGVIIIEMKK